MKKFRSSFLNLNNPMVVPDNTLLVRGVGGFLKVCSWFLGYSFIGTMEVQNTHVPFRSNLTGVRNALLLFRPLGQLHSKLSYWPKRAKGCSWLLWGGSSMELGGSGLPLAQWSDRMFRNNRMIRNFDIFFIFLIPCSLEQIFRKGPANKIKK